MIIIINYICYKLQLTSSVLLANIVNMANRANLIIKVDNKLCESHTNLSKRKQNTLCIFVRGDNVFEKYSKMSTKYEKLWQDSMVI